MAGRYANQKDTGEACAYADGEKNKHSEAKRRLCSMWLIKKNSSLLLLRLLLFSAQHSIIISVFPCSLSSKFLRSQRRVVNLQICTLYFTPNPFPDISLA